MPSARLSASARAQLGRTVLAAYACIRKQRASARHRALLQLENQLLAGQQDAIVAVLALSCADESEGRRVVERALGKWRGSTLNGYLALGDEVTFKSTFRCTRHRFNDLVQRLAGN